MPITAAAPPMSLFIVSIDVDGLREYPPVSKVRPLPTSPIFSLFLGLPIYLITINFGSWIDPFATSKNAFIPNFSISFLSNISTSNPLSFPTKAARSAKVSGYNMLAGSFTRSRAKITPSITLLASAIFSTIFPAFSFGAPNIVTYGL